MGESVAEGLLDQRAQRDPVPRGVNPCGFEQTTLAIHAGLLAHVFVSPGYARMSLVTTATSNGFAFCLARER